MLKYEFFTLSLTKSYSLKEFKRDLKAFFEAPVVHDRPTIILFEQYQLIQSEFLEILNSLISSYEVASLFQPDEIDNLVSQASGLSSEGLSNAEAFVHRLKKNLHIVISLDHTHHAFLSKCAANPAFITKCALIWLEVMSQASLQAIADEWLKDPELASNLDAKTLKAIKSQVIEMTHSLDYKMMTPIAFYKNLKLYKRIFTEKFEQQRSATGHLEIGIQKLQEANKQVAELSEDAAQKKILLVQKEKDANIALESMSQKMNAANAKKLEIEEKQKRIHVEEAKTEQDQIEVQKKLERTQPMVEEAQKQVGSISKSHINELKALRQPPEPCADVLCAVLKIFKINDDSWSSMKKFLNKPGFIEEVISFVFGWKINA